MITGKLGNKIFVVILILSAVPFLMVSYVSLMNIENMKEITRLHTQELADISINRSRTALEDIGKNVIKQKAEDVAKQCEIYIKTHPSMTVLDLQNDSYFQKIAVQPVGKTGYTALTDYNTLTCRFHKDPKIVDLDMSTLSANLPGFWAIMSRTRGGVPAEGFYDWKDPDGKIRNKYMYIAIINAKTADNVGMHVAATTYIDEFLEPAEDVSEKISIETSHAMSETEKITSATRAQFLIILFSSLFTIFIIAIAVSKSIVMPVSVLTETSKEISGGNLDVKINVKSRDEIGELAQSFSKMTKDLSESRNKIEQHEKELEQKVSERTLELDSKVKELEENRIAILNMMEDSEEANRRLLRTQEELKKALDEIKKMDVKKDEFISITAHEFKTPLTAIHGFSELLQNERIDSKSRKKYLKIMVEETKRLAKMVTEIFDLSRIDLGTFKFNFEETDLRNIIDDTKNEIKIPAASKGLKATYTIAANVPKTIVADAERLRQILINLLINSVKYTPKGSIEMSVAREGNDLKFTVKDTGIGIARENIPKLFQRFYQIDSSYTRSVRGSGLGLALCKELVEGMGGRIWVESGLGKGTAFHFTLPFKPEINRGQANKL